MAKEYIQVHFSSIEPEQQEWVMALLMEEGYEGCEQRKQELFAFIPAEQYDLNWLEAITYPAGLKFTTSSIAAQNWNAVWESNFQPVIVDDFVGIRAHFHAPVTGVEHEIVITPKMSFGTGHHATTFMMMQNMRQLDFTDHSVFDFGTGTGVLAILAAKLGATHITAIDNDDWSIENAAENIARNTTIAIDLFKADTPVMDQPFDIILANINKHIILQYMHDLCNLLKPAGTILFSGLLKEDETDILHAAQQKGLRPVGRTERDNWLCLKMAF